MMQFFILSIGQGFAVVFLHQGFCAFSSQSIYQSANDKAHHIIHDANEQARGILLDDEDFTYNI